MDSLLHTPATHPGDPVVGHWFGGHSYEKKATAIYFCDAYDPQMGYWMTNVADAADRRNVSERAIGKNFHEATDRGDHWFVSQWNVCFPKFGIAFALLT